MDNRLNKSLDTYKGYTLVNELGIEKHLFFRPNEETESTIIFWQSKGWEIKDVYTSLDLSVFLAYWFKYFGKLATDREQNFCCGKVKLWGTYCRELIDYMGDEDLDWEDIGVDGELYIHLSIVADNHKFCVLMED